MSGKEYLRIELLAEGSRDSLVHTCPNLIMKSSYPCPPKCKGSGNTLSVTIYKTMYKMILYR